MTKQIAFGLAAVAGMAFITTQASTRVAAQAGPIEQPIVFQAAGPSVASIQSMVDAFRAALGGSNNANLAGPLFQGRREINWDGGGSTATSPAPTPFDGFLVTRGARFTTPGSGFVQAPVEGVAATFGNPSYATIFRPFSPVRLFSAVNSNITHARFFIPGGGELPATTSGFGAIFSDVDTQEIGRLHPTTLVFFDVDGNYMYDAIVPASPGDGSLSFLGVLFSDARIARVLINVGNITPGPDDRDNERDVVMMDDFIYGEPRVVEGPAALRMLSEAQAEDGH
jgi:hypothetical protein